MKKAAALALQQEAEEQRLAKEALKKKEAAALVLQQEAKKHRFAKEALARKEKAERTHTGEKFENFLGAGSAAVKEYACALKRQEANKWPSLQLVARQGRPSR